MRHLLYCLWIVHFALSLYAYRHPRLLSRARGVCRHLQRSIPSPLITTTDHRPSRLLFGKKVSEDDDILQDEDPDYDAVDEDARVGEIPEFDVLSTAGLVDDEDDDDDEQNEDEEEEGSEGEEDEEGARTSTSESSENTESAWLLRRKLRAADPTRRRRKTWEEKYEDNPYKSSQPTVTWNPEPDRFSKWYLAVAKVVSDEMSERRSEAWVHHMQWARRTAIYPLSNVSVAWDYSRLSGDYMNVEGQALALRANSTDEVFDLLKTEPLTVHGGVTPWKVYEMDIFDHENTDWYFTDPFIFTGSANIDDGKWEKLVEESRSYHAALHKGVRVSQLAHLREELPSSSKKKSKEKGLLVVYNAKTIKGALKYVMDDPLLSRGLIKESVLTPMNIQDVTGLHHIMPRSFSQLQELQQFHSMDPEDLLKEEVEVLPGLEHHSAANADILSKLQSMNISYAYTRWSIAERFDNIITDADAKNWNDLMAKAQSIRFLSSDDASRINGVFVEDPLLENMGGVDDSVDIAAD